jgi:ParB family chromosome partitioning protein
LETRRRGLGSLIPGIEEGWPQRAEGVQHVRVDDISANPYQPRRQYDPEKLTELADSMRTHGVVQPLVVRTCDNGYELIAGERRLMAARQAGLQQVPVVVRECSDRELLELALIENLQREDINCIEAGLAYRRLVDEFDMTQEQVSETLGKSRSAVANTLRLLTLPEQVQASLLQGRISEGHGRALLALEDRDSIVTLCERIERYGLSVRQTEMLTKLKRPVKDTPRQAPPHAKQELDANVRLLQDRMRQALGTKVTIHPRGESGAIEIEYYAQEDLDRISAYILREERDEDAS